MPQSWRIGLGVARVLLAFCLYAAETYPTWIPVSSSGVLYAVYFVFSLGTLLWFRRQRQASELFRLIIDLIVFLVATVQPPDRSGWFVSLFYLLLLANAALLHRLREVAVVVLVSVCFTLLVAPTNVFTMEPAIVIPGALALALAWRGERLEELLSHSAKQTVLFRTEAENARELERQRIAADFHDGPLQSFISFQMRLEVIKKLLSRDQKMAVEDIGQLQEICKKQITDMRAFVRSMRSTAEGSTPATSVRQIAEDFQKTSGIQLIWNVTDALSGLEPEVSHEVLQIIREALHNAQKHSKASKVTLQTEKDEGHLAINVEDDGSGFPFAGTYNLDELELMRMGPESIKRRVRSLGGDLSLQSIPGRGAAVRIRVPV